MYNVYAVVPAHPWVRAAVTRSGAAGDRSQGRVSRLGYPWCVTDLRPTSAAPRPDDADEPAPHLGVMARLQSSGAARRLYPVPVGLALAKARAEHVWRQDGAARAKAVASMELLVGETERAGEVQQLARAHLYQQRAYQELLFRPEVVMNRPVAGLDRIREHARAGTGVILSVVHQGHFAAHSACIARHGLPITVLIAPTLMGEQPPTHSGLLRAQLFRTFSSGENVSVLDSTGSYDVLRTQLESGGTVLLGCDLEGRTPVRFLGRTYGVPSGTGRLAMDTGAPVLPVHVVRDGHLERLEIGEPVLPADHDDHRSVLQAVFDRHAPTVLAWPEAVERPPSHFHPVA